MFGALARDGRETEGGAVLTSVEDTRNGTTFGSERIGAKMEGTLQNVTESLSG